MDPNRDKKWRKELRELSDEDLLDELQRPRGDWAEDTMREALYRILKKLTVKKSK